MVTARQIDSNGNEISGTDKYFSDERFAEMEKLFGVKLRWRKVEAKPLKKKQLNSNKDENEKSDLPVDVSDNADDLRERSE